MGLKLFRWALSATFFIAGLSFLIMADEGATVKPLILTIFCFGACYVMYRGKGSSDNEKQILLASALTIIVAALLAKNVSLEGSFAHELAGLDESLLWMGWNLIIGIPVMWYAYKKYD